MAPSSVDDPSGIVEPPMFEVLFLLLCVLEEDLCFLVDFECPLFPFVELTPEAAPLISTVVSMSAEVSVVVPVASLEVLEVLLPFWAVRLGTEQHDAIMVATALGLV